MSPTPAVPGPPRVREGTAADAPAVAALYTASRRDAYAGLLPPELLDADAAQQDLLWELRLTADYGPPADTPVLLLAETPGHPPLGFAHLVPLDGTVHLEHLHVHPAHTGRGLGSLLLRTALDRHPTTPLRLDVLAANHRAITFYERHGARLLGTGTAHFPDGTTLPELTYGWR
ncbi:GNAT family N-acetyltransferase [Kitasatospora sp. NPDC088134]|uniref:GNAT family N-acetyltransferase n=1 Tax=Kitasatospora sp. NPDC088134 TaxID=3364071 RepID=UPI0038134CA1